MTRGQPTTASEADEIARPTPAPKEDPFLGKTLGKYAVLESIGEGAMGRVYRAKQTSLDKPIALKVLHRHLTGEERIAKRFHREARAASRLSHPNAEILEDQLVPLERPVRLLGLHLVGPGLKRPTLGPAAVEDRDVERQGGGRRLAEVPLLGHEVLGRRAPAQVEGEP